MPISKFGAGSGLGVFHFAKEQPGWFAEFKFVGGYADPEPYYSDLVAGENGDPISDRSKQGLLFNLGATYLFERSFGIFGGIGIVDLMGYAEQQDASGTLGRGGSRYFVTDPTRDRTWANLSAGVLWRPSDHWSLLASFDTAVQGISLSAGFVF